MAVLFLALGFKNLDNIRKCMIILKSFRVQSLRDDPNNDIMGP